MTVRELEISGVLLLVPEPVRDERGFFARTWDAADVAGIDGFVQQSVAFNDRAGTVRGLHLAAAPAAEVKAVRCLRGAIYDVVVDVRFGSGTFGRHVGVRLDANDRNVLVVPRGCAHGYQTLVDGTEVQYDISEPFRSELAAGCAHDDPALKIAWPLAVSVISERDAALPSFAELAAAERGARVG